MKKQNPTNLLGSQEKIYYRMKGLNPRRFMQDKKVFPTLTDRKSQMILKLEEIKAKRTMKKD